MESNNKAVQDFVVVFRHGDGKGERLLADFAKKGEKEDFGKYLEHTLKATKEGDWYKLTVENFWEAEKHTKPHNHQLTVRDLAS